MTRAIGVAAVVAAGVAPRAAVAEVEHRFELGAGTAVPLAVDVEATLHLTDRVALEAAVGVMPPRYVDLINAAVVAVDGYDDATAELIAAALDTAAVARAAVAVRPFAISLAFHAGYSIAALGGGVGAAAAIEAVTGEDVRADAGAEVPMHSTVHFVQVGAAWRVALTRCLVLRVSLEYTQPFASSSGLDARGRSAASQARIDHASAELDAYLDDVYIGDVKTPVVGVSLRWRPVTGR